MRKVTKKCSLCNKDYEPNGHFERSKYCSSPCRQASYRERKLRSQVHEVCLYCGVGVIGANDLYDGKCSAKCERAAARHMKQGGVCRKCGALWLGQANCRECGGLMKVRAF